MTTATKTTTTHYKIANNLFLAHLVVDSHAKVAAKPVEVPTHHVFVIDCSGSMSGSLSQIREHIKSKLPKLLGDQDTVSMVWFSGRGEYGVLMEGEPANNAGGLATINKALDRWLRPVGATGFKEPLEEASKVITRLMSKKGPGAVSFFFLSDGCDNAWGRGEILKAVSALKSQVNAAAVVEYGYYADRSLLTDMATKMGGTHIFADGFSSYAPAMEGVMSRKATASGIGRVEVGVRDDVIGGFVFGKDGKDLVSFEVEKGVVSLPKGLNEVWYLSPTSDGTSRPFSDGVDQAKEAAYSALSLFALRGKPEVIYPILSVLGDVRLIDDFSGCFGKQKYTDFMAISKEAAFDPKARLVRGYDPKRVPAEDAFTVLDLLDILSGDDRNRVMVQSPAFRYNRIGRAQESASSRLTTAEVEEIDKINEDLAKKPSLAAAKKLQARLAEILDTKSEGLKFVPSEEGKEEGYSISNLTYNEDRPNVSFLVKMEGTVDLGDRVPEQYKSILGGPVFTFIHRNYTVIKDGMVNIETLPVKLAADSRAKLAKAIPDRLEDVPGSDVVLINLKGLPVVNRKMIKGASANALASLYYDLTKARAEQKVFKGYLDTHFPKKSQGYAALYGDEFATWLKEQGITDYGGFSPKTVAAAATDFYMAKELGVALKGLSTLPKVADVQAKKGKLTTAGSMMVTAVETCEKASKEEGFEAFLRQKAGESVTRTRSLLRQIARVKFAVIVGQVWFSEFKSIEENTLNFSAPDGLVIPVTFKMEEVRVDLLPNPVSRNPKGPLYAGAFGHLTV